LSRIESFEPYIAPDLLQAAHFQNLPDGGVFGVDHRHPLSLRYFPAFVRCRNRIWYRVSGPHPIAADIILAVPTASATFPMSWLTYKTIEMPFHEWGRRRVRAKLA
jgi:hypothetical protein